jgi:hypothetical protein
MADPVLGTDVIIQFLKNGNYVNYGCATNIEIQYTMETKGTKTIGDGVWRRKRGQNLGAVINLTGVIVIDANKPTVFDLLNYLKSLADVQYRLRFTDNGGGVVVIDGDALPTAVSISGGIDGYGTGDITLDCNGDPDYITPIPDPDDPDPDPDNPNECIAEIASASSGTNSFPASRYVTIESMVPGSAPIQRWDYKIDGGGTLTAFTDQFMPVSFTIPLAYLSGSHTVEVTPICENGFPGVPYTFTY